MGLSSEKIHISRTMDRILSKEPAGLTHAESAYRAFDNDAGRVVFAVPQDALK